MTPIQERLFQMLREIVSICEQHDITYYAAGGTALGALRHKGFIPWDDDVDLMMPHDDWKRFVQVARQGLPAGRRLCCLELDEEYPHVFGRYVDTTSTSIHYNQFLGGTPEGFVIDIFVLDAVSNDGPSFAQHRETLSLYNDLSNPLGYSYPLSSNPDLIVGYTKRMEAEGRRAVLEELESRLCTCPFDEGTHLVMRWACAPRLFKKELFSYKRFEDFEGLKIQVPSLCADYLVQHYGDDWMYIPAHSQRIVHDAITFVDVDYQTVQADYLPFVDIEKTKKAILARRAAHIRDMRKINHAQDLKARLLSSYAHQVTLQRAWDAFGEQSGEKQGVLDVEGVFSAFYRLQCDADLEGREEYLAIRRYYDPVYIDIGDELLSMALLNLLDTNRVGKAARILRVRELTGVPLEKPLERAKDLLKAVRTPASLYDVGLADEAYDFACDLLERRPQSFSVRLFVLQRLYEMGRLDELGPLAKEGLEWHPSAGEFLKYEADARFAHASSAEDIKQAVRAYETALSLTTNAFVASEATRRIEQLRGADASADATGSEDYAGEPVQAVPAQTPLYDREDVKRKMLTLLSELDGICKDNGIEHYLGPVACGLALVHGGNAFALPQLDCMVPARHMTKLAEILCSLDQEGRTCECWLTNPHYLSFSLDYVDTTSTYLQLGEGTNIREHGLKIKVFPLREAQAPETGAAAVRAKAAASIEPGWEINGYNLTRRITAKRALRAAAARYLMLGGRRRLARALFKSLSEEPQRSSGQKALRFVDSTPLTIDASQFQQDSTLSFDGVDFPSVADAEGLMAQIYGSNWRSVIDSLKTQPGDTLIEPDLPYGMLLKNLEAQGCALGDYFKEMRSLRIGMLGQVHNLRLRNRAMALAERTRDRKLIYDALHQHEHELAACSQRQDFDGLQELLGDYERAAKAYLKKDLGLCPCKEHMDLLCELWRHNGQVELADKLYALAPAEHYSPLSTDSTR